MLPFLPLMHPTYSLTLVKGLMRDGSWFATGEALDGAGALGLDDEDIYDCVVNQLTETHFYKTMAAKKMVGCMQDVYHITYRGFRLYLKLQVRDQAVVISFKEQ